MNDKPLVQSVAFDGDGGVEITFCQPSSDIKGPGLAMIRTFVVAGGGEFDDEIAALTEAAMYLAGDVMDTFNRLPAPEVNEPEPDQP